MNKSVNIIILTFFLTLLLCLLLYQPAVQAKSVEIINEETLKHIFEFDRGVVTLDWDYIVLHHSATEYGNAKTFDRYHRDHFKDPNGLEYHFVILNGKGKKSIDGLIEVGHRWQKQIQGNHLFRPENFLNSIAICFVGNFEENDSLSNAQIDAAARLILKLKTRYEIKKILMHKDIDNPKVKDLRPTSVCPGKHFPFDKILERIKEIGANKIKG